MAEELISSYLDINALKAQTDFFLNQLSAIKKSYDEINNTQVSLKGSNSSCELVNSLNQITTASNQVADAQNRLAQARDVIQTQKQLSEAVKTFESSEREAIKTSKLKNQESGKSIALSAKEQKAIDDLSNDYKQLSLAYADAALKAKNLGLAQGFETKAAKEAAAYANSLGDILKKADAVTGTFNRNVGNYPKLEGITNALSGLLSTAAIGVGISGISDFFSSTIDEANQAEQATTRFKNALQNIGREDVFERLSKKADGFVQTFRYLDNDNVTEVFQQLITYGKLTEKQITDLTPVIINFAAKSGLSLQESASTIIRALEGNARALKEYGVNIQKGGTATENLGTIMDQLKPKVEGAADAFQKTFAGSVAVAKQDVANLKEEIGNKFTPVLLKFYQSVNYIISGIKSIGENATSAIIGTIKSLSSFASFLKDGFTNPENILTQVAYRKAENKSIEDNIKNQKELNAAKQAAASIAKDASSKPLKEQQELLKSQIALKEASFKTYDTLVSNGKRLTKEGREATLQLYADTQVVFALQKTISEGQDKTVLGIGDPNANGKKTKTEKTKKDAIDHSKTIADEIADLRKDLSTINNQELIGQITPKEADIDRVKAYDKAFKGIFDLGGNANTPIVKQLSVELSPISKRVLEGQIKELVAKLNEHSKTETFNFPVEDIKKRVDLIINNTKNPFNKLFETNDAEYTNELKKLDELQKNKLISVEDYKKRKEAIDKTYSDRELSNAITFDQAIIDNLKGRSDGSKEYTDKIAEYEKQLNELKRKLYGEDYKNYVDNEKKKKDQAADLEKTKKEIAEAGDSGYIKEENRIQKLIDLNDQQSSKELDNISRGTLSEQDKAAKTIEIQAKQQAKQRELQRQLKDEQLKQARFDRDTQALKILGEGIYQAAKAGFITPLGIAIEALTAIQIAALYAKPLPHFQHGIESHTGGPFVWGEAGKELAIEPGGKAYFSPETATYATAPAGTKIVPSYELHKYFTNVSTNSTDRVLNSNYQQNELVGLNKESNRKLDKIANAISNIPAPRINIRNAYDPAFKTYVDRNVFGKKY